MYDIFLSIDENTKLEELEKIVRYNIGKANILREKIKELDKVEMLTEKRSNEIKEIQKEEEVDSEEIEEGKSYEFTFASIGNSKKEDIESIFTNHKLLSIIATDKEGLEQVNESVCE